MCFYKLFLISGMFSTVSMKLRESGPESTFSKEGKSLYGKDVVVVVVVWQCTIINEMVSLGELKLFCIARCRVLEC